MKFRIKNHTMQLLIENLKKFYIIPEAKSK